ncbi:hypothetical protein pb186bvf_014636 [Paramecium bursaria]
MNITDYRNHQNELQQGCFKRRAPWELQPDRKIIIGTPDKNIPNNRVETSKYNVITFLPKNIMEQFTKTSNVYFLLLGIFQILPAVTTTDGTPTVYAPLLFIIIVSMIKDFYEDYKRHIADKEENEREIQRYSIRTEVFEYDKWQNLYVGDIIRITNRQRVPADVILLASSKNSECFIETKNLDGETNLKCKSAPPSLNAIYKNLTDKRLPYDLFISLDFEKQNPLMYKFKGYFTIEKEKKRNNREYLNYDNFIERGCSIQNTEWVLAVVVYTGHDSKIMMNSISGKMKYSTVEKLMGKQILWVFLVLILQCILASIYYNIWYQRNQYDLPYLEISSVDPEQNQFYDFVLRFAMWFLLMGNSVPISLLVTLETVKFFQAQILQQDKNYQFQGRSAEVHSSNLAEELGVIEYIFSDKTGTLTQNIMKFKSLAVNGIKYGLQDQQDELFDDEKLVFQKAPTQAASPHVDFSDLGYTHTVKEEIQLNKNSIKLNQDWISHKNIATLLCLSLCHTIQTESVKNDDEIVYNASSPDELALVSFAAEQGFKYLGKEESVMKLQCRQTKEILTYQIMQVIEFNSTRKRMSIILKDQSGKLILFCKGADNVILSMLEDRLEEDQEYRQVIYDTKKLLQEYAQQGLRTLVLAAKNITSIEFENFQKAYNKCQEYDVETRDIEIAKLEEDLEQNLTLLAATAIEDKLQENVGEVIADLKKAGINVWVLTGDKIETAINIGYSCKLLQVEIKQFIIDGETEDQVDRQLNKSISFVDSNPVDQISLIISGVALVIIIHNYQDRFFKLANRANSVMCCRVSPKQKQEVVQLIRKSTGKITLAIGDGANDVAMITQAHVGIGIRGLEGQQASKAADYAVGEFQQLRRLLLYSGREYYRKNSNLILFNFYKNQLFIGAVFFFGLTNGFSGSIIYDQWLSQVFNVFFTSLPIILYALFDEEHPSSEFLELIIEKPNYLEKHPEEYVYIKKPIFTLKAFWRWFFWGFLQASLLMTLNYFSYEPKSPYQNGRNSFYLESGMIILGCVVFIANIRVILMHNTNYPIVIYINILQSLTFIIFFWGFSQYTYFESYSLFDRLYENRVFYFQTFLMLCITNFFDLGIFRYSSFSKNYKQKQLHLEISQE